MKYKSAVSDAELNYLKSGWDLEDAEFEELHNSTKNALSYIFGMARKYGFTGDSAKYVLRDNPIEKLIEYSTKPDSQLAQKIAWLEGHRDTYAAFGPYWLELAKDYYKDGQYENCLIAVASYEAVTSRISLRDSDYANALPMAIISAKETMSKAEYCATARRYCEAILHNTEDKDWSLKYFVAQIYLDLCAITGDSSCLEEAYKIAKDNVVNLVDEQKALNSAYQEELEDVIPEKGATKRQEEEIKRYNELAKQQRKVALPPVSEALYLNCDLLFALAKQLDVSRSEQKNIEDILHENWNNIFLADALDDRFWFGNHVTFYDASALDAAFDGKSLTIPATCVTDRSIITVTVSGSEGATVFDDWAVTNVDRQKSEDVSKFKATFESKQAKDYKYQLGETVTIRVIPVAESMDKYIEIKFKTVEAKKLMVLNEIGFERVAE